MLSRTTRDLIHKTGTTSFGVPSSYSKHGHIAEATSWALNGADAKPPAISLRLNNMDPEATTHDNNNNDNNNEHNNNDHNHDNNNNDDDDDNNNNNDDMINSHGSIPIGNAETLG